MFVFTYLLLHDTNNTLFPHERVPAPHPPRGLTGSGSGDHLPDAGSRPAETSCRRPAGGRYVEKPLFFPCGLWMLGTVRGSEEQKRSQPRAGQAGGPDTGAGGEGPWTPRPGGASALVEAGLGGHRAAAGTASTPSRPPGPGLYRGRGQLGRPLETDTFWSCSVLGKHKLTETLAGERPQPEGGSAARTFTSSKSQKCGVGDRRLLRSLCPSGTAAWAWAWGARVQSLLAQTP